MHSWREKRIKRLCICSVFAQNVYILILLGKTKEWLNMIEDLIIGLLGGAVVMGVLLTVGIPLLGLLILMSLKVVNEFERGV